MANRSASSHANRKRSGGKHRAQRQTPEVVVWLGAGAVTLGLGAAMASGTGVASAETGGESSSTASSSSDSGSHPGADSSNAADSPFDRSSDKEAASVEGDGDNEDGKGGLKKVALDSSAETADEDDLPEAGEREKPEIKPGKTGISTVATTLDDHAEELEEEPLDDEPVVAEVFTLAASAVRETQHTYFVTSPSPVPTVVEQEEPLMATAAVSPTPPGYTDTEWEAYVQKFKDLDPEGIYNTPASPGWQEPLQYFSEEQFRAGMVAVLERGETTGFALTSSGLLRYTNWRDIEVGLLYGEFPKFDTWAVAPVAGLLRVRPGDTIVISDPQAKIVWVQLSVFDDPERQYAELAVLGYPPFGTSPGGTVPPRNVVQAFISAVINTVQQAIQSLVNSYTSIANGVRNSIAEIQWNAKKSAPANVAELHDRLRDWTGSSTNSIYIERVQDKRVDGTDRIIVYIGGTTGDWWGDNQSGITNLPAYRGDVKSHQVNAINSAIGSRLGVEILIVGFSQGGLDAQNLAEQEWRLNGNVRAIVTYGSPIIHNISDNYESIHLGAFKDPVTGLSKKDQLENNIANLRTYATTPATHRKYSAQWWNPNKEIDYHGDRATYSQVTRAFVSSRDTRYDHIKGVVGEFRGKVTGIW